MTVEIPAD